MDIAEERCMENKEIWSIPEVGRGKDPNAIHTKKFPIKIACENDLKLVICNTLPKMQIHLCTESNNQSSRSENAHCFTKGGNVFCSAHAETALDHFQYEKLNSEVKWKEKSFVNWLKLSAVAHLELDLSKHNRVCGLSLLFWRNSDR